MSRRYQVLLIYLFLTLVPLTVFWQVNSSEYLNYDDPLYVTENSLVKNGISLEGIRSAFTTISANFWHPLTMISHMVDTQIFGIKPQGHHLTSLLLHIVNTLLLFSVFDRMTKSVWPSAFVAAFFALHPLHVESVAWVAARKDVLFTFFFLLTLRAYVHYVEHPRPGTYMAVFVFFLMGMMAKPMLITLPFVLLLLDYWPLGRTEQRISTHAAQPQRNEPKPLTRTKGRPNRTIDLQGKIDEQKEADQPSRWELIRSLLWEKIPLFALIPFFSVLTYVAEGQAVTKKAPGVWISNCIISYVIYIGKTIWPHNLAVFYPFPASWPLWQALGAAAILCAVTFIVIFRAREFPYLTSGWLWFAGTLVPVIGIVRIGSHAMADRYTYIPLIGLSIMIAWGIPELLKKWRYRTQVLFALSALSLSALSILTWLQVGYWHDSITLYNHALEVTSNNALIHLDRGVAYVERGDYRKALKDYEAFIKFQPEMADGYYNVGIALCRMGKPADAVPNFDRAIEIGPVFSKLYYNRAIAHDNLGNERQAIADYDKAIEMDNKDAAAYSGRGSILGKTGNIEQAIRDFDMAIMIDPKYADAYFNRGISYAATGNYNQAIPDFDKVTELNPNSAGAYDNRGTIHAKLGNFKEALADFDKSIEISPQNADAYYKRAFANAKLGNNARGRDDLKASARFGNEDARQILRSQGVAW